MLGALYLSPYLLIPLLLAVSFKLLKISTKHTWFAYVITTIILFFYPIVYFQIDDYFHPPDHHCVDCGMVNISLIIVGLVVFLPIAIGLQWLFNFFFDCGSCRSRLICTFVVSSWFVFGRKFYRLNGHNTLLIFIRFITARKK